MLSRGRRERFKSSLNDALGADVYPAPSGHLTVHCQFERLESVELIASRPVRDQIRISDEHTRGVAERSKDSDGFPGLHQQRFVILEAAKRLDDGVIAHPVSRSASGTAVDDQ